MCGHEVLLGLLQVHQVLLVVHELLVQLAAVQPGGRGFPRPLVALQCVVPLDEVPAVGGIGGGGAVLFRLWFAIILCGSAGESLVKTLAQEKQ